MVKVECGIAYSFALSDMGNLYVWGVGGRGQMGNGRSTTVNKLPVVVAALQSEMAVDIYCGGGNLCALIASCGEGVSVLLWLRR